MSLKHQNVKNLYNDFIPFPGDYIRLLNEKNIFIKLFYTFLTKYVILTKKKSRIFVQSRFHNIKLDFEKSLNIIDIGCGTGEKAIKYALAFPNSKVLGIDFSEKSLEYANQLKEYLDIKNISFKKFDLLNDDYKTLGQFDILQSGGVIHHTDDPTGILKNIRNYLMHDESIIWLYLYSIYGKKHIEECVRTGIRKLIPNDDNFKERMDLLGELGINEKYLSEFSRRENWWDRVKKIYFNIRTLGYYLYTTQKKQKDADTYIHPLSIKYDAIMLKKLFEGANLNLIEFLILPDLFSIKENKTLQETINKKNMDIFDRLDIYSNLIVAANYYLILRR